MEKEAQKITRRELLKILAASSGAVTAAAFLPGKWIKPLINTGVLPAHAQASLYNITASLEGTTQGDLTFSCTISPAVAGINMQAAVTLNSQNPAFENGAGKMASLIQAVGINQTLTGSTSASGTATFSLTPPACARWGGSVVYSFVTPVSCSVCSLTKPVTIDMPC